MVSLLTELLKTRSSVGAYHLISVVEEGRGEGNNDISLQQKPHHNIKTRAEAMTIIIMTVLRSILLYYSMSSY